MNRPPLILRPTYLGLAPPDQAADAAKSLATSAADACRRIPGGGLIGATLLGVTAAYFVPKLFDYIGHRIAHHGQDQADEFDLEVEE